MDTKSHLHNDNIGAEIKIRCTDIAVQEALGHVIASAMVSSLTKIMKYA
ncbi:MAG TPA: hypothetical protein VFC66_04795 [Anaerolineaceae bacterium]|nr:hypothetical protein [Anaerolineaceae bacterium]